MSRPALSASLGRLARAADHDPPADGRLVARFARTRDPDAFAELVRRVGPMVLGVCRRVTGDSHLADDAFQAAFLVLARRAGRVERPDEIRGWMYGVAVRVAREARAVSARRRAREAPVPTLPDRPAESHQPPDADALRALDEEVAALPDHIRAAVVLCELDGVSRRDAAGRLGVPEGTISSRLAKGRKLLTDRLRKRGVAALGLAALAPAAVPPRLSAAASALASGEPASATVAALAHGVVRAMVVQKLKLAPLAVAAVAAAVFAASLLAAPPASDAPPAPPAAVTVTAVQPAAARPVPKGPSKILINKNRTLVLIDPDGKDETPLASHDPKTGFAFDAKLSPDGKRVAVVCSVASAPGEQVPRRSLFIHTLGAKAGPVDLGIDCERVHWSADGSELVAGRAAGRPGMHEWAGFDHRIVDAQTGKATRVRLPEEHVVTGWLADGRFATTQLSFTTTEPKGRVYLMNRDGTESKAVTDGTDVVVSSVPSPDGARLLGLRPALTRVGGKVDSGRYALVLIDVATGRGTPVADIAPDGDLQGVCWSPDGTRIAYTWRQIHPGTDDERGRKETEWRLVVADADGRNPRTVLTAKGPGQWIFTLGAPDWR
ncbi:sigma-70 family RNA polymerase sigma factor [bacterium]|nr:sigma-70 family RNA polymerase sigma factor [bacterium]